MNLKVEKEIFEAYQDLKIGVILVKGLNLTRASSSVQSLLRGISAQRGREFAEKDVREHPRVAVWDSAYGNFGINPKKYPCSISALLERVKNQKEIPHVNSLVDLYNYYSLKYLLPIGGDDMDWLCGDIKLAFTKGGEAFRPMNSINVEEAGEGEVAYMDRGGITCRYWNHRDCERTKFTNKTVNAMLLVEDMSKLHMDEFGRIIDDIVNGIKKYIGGRTESYILNEENPSVDLGIQGRNTVNDGRVPQQEKAHFLEMEKLKKKELRKSKKSSKKDDTIEQIVLIQEDMQSLKVEDENTFKQKIKKIMEMAIMMAFPKILNPEVNIEYPSSRDHGDYACNVAMHLTKMLGLPPRDIAEKIVKNIKQKDFKIEIAGPGFINFYISDDLLKGEVKKVLKEKENYGGSEIGKEKVVVLDYSSPNIAKPLGVHHLLSTIIGQSLYNIFSHLGFQCVSVNHIGDWGTQFGKLIFAYKKWGNKEVVEAAPISELLKLYVKFHDEVEINPSLEDEARNEFRKFEEGDEENRKLWEWFVAESMKELNKTYKDLGGIHFDYVQGESFYEDKMGDILKEGKERNIFEVGEEGAYVVKYDDSEIAPFVVQKKDGTTLYSTRDFATLKYRINTWHPVRVLYIVDVAQSMHFKQLFTGAERFSWYHGEAVHVSFGRMHMKDGNMSTRKGNVVLLDDVLKEGITRARKVIEEKNPALENKENVSRTVGVGSIKYSILYQNRTTDITFDWDKMLSLEGNSAPYLQYTYARAKSILRKVKAVVADTDKKSDPEDVKTKTSSLVRFFPKFSEVVSFAAKEYKPNYIGNYLYELSQEFNSFYNSVPVLKAENKKDIQSRVKIVEAVSQILKNGLDLLGIEVVEEM